MKIIIDSQYSWRTSTIYVAVRDDSGHNDILGIARHHAKYSTKLASEVTNKRFIFTIEQSSNCYY